jgi:hypothetical protein
MTFTSTFSKRVHQFLIFPVLSLVAMILFYRLVFLPAHCSLVIDPICVPKAEASSKLTFGSLPSVTLSLPLSDVKGSWAWSGAPAYKNDRLRAYQDLLRARGITGMADLKLLTAQLIQENGALDETVIGDHGCSIGILQYNVCVHHHMKAATWLKLPQNQVWKDYRFQLSVMADAVASRYQKFHGNLKQVIVAHNSPAAAARGTDTRAGYYSSIVKRSAVLTAL